MTSSLTGRTIARFGVRRGAAILGSVIDQAMQRAALELLDEALAHLDDGDLDGAQRCIDEARDAAPELPAVRSAQGQLYAAQERHAEARRELSAALSLQPDDVEAHYTLARLHELAGEHDPMVLHDLAVLRLDAAADRRAGLGDPRMLDAIGVMAEAVLADLPGEFAERLANVPIVLEPRPSASVVREGFDPRALGLFEGADDCGQATGTVTAQPTRIVLFYANLLAECATDAELEEQVEVTLLHEIGHFFGLDEDGVEALGLA